jgi:hypothetical protein
MGQRRWNFSLVSALLLLVYWITTSVSLKFIPSFSYNRLRPSFGKYNRIIDYRNQISQQTASTLHASVSPGGGISPEKPKPRSSAFIISPSSQSSENELLILQNFNQIQYGEKKKFGVLGTQDLSSNHKQMVELLSYALVLSGNHVFTSAGGVNGTNLAVIKGALRACNPDLLTVILPQSLFCQPPEIHSLLLR